MGKLLDENSLRAIRTFVRTSIATAISTVYKPQGSSSVSDLNGLTKVEAMNGYVYDVTNSGNLNQNDGTTIHVNQGENTVFIWNNGSWYWDVLGGIVDLSNLVPKNSNAHSLTGAIKVNVDENGLVIGSSALLASDIPNLDASKITSGTFADARIASASTWNAKYDKPSGGIPASDLAESYVKTNALINGATKCKITFDSKGLVTAGADLVSSDIPNLDASKITSGTFADARIASAFAWNAKYDKPREGIPASDLAETYVVANAAITGATKCKITYDSKGLVTAGADLVSSDIPNLSSIYLNVDGSSSNPTQTQINGIRQRYLHLISSYDITNHDDFQDNPSNYLLGWKYYSGVSYGECFYLSEPFKGKNEQQLGYAIAIGSSGFTLDTCHNGDLGEQSSLVAHISSEIVYFSISQYTLSLTATNGLTLNGTPILLANAAITGATKCKITYDSKGLVTAGADLVSSDIPNLDTSKITSGTFADARIASASTWNAKYAKPSGGIPASDLAESYILSSAKGSANGVASLGSDGKVPTSQLPIIGNPTSFSWTDGSSSGPTGTLVVDGANNVSFPAIPAASGIVSGVITTGIQSFSGIKTFLDPISFRSTTIDITNNNDMFTINLDTDIGGNNTFLRVCDENNGKISSWVTETLTANRTYTFPDKTGTIALLEDLPQILDYRS